MRRRCWITFSLLLACSLGAADEPAVGTELGALTIGSKTYQAVRVRSITPRTLVIQHEGGLASLPLRDLPPDLQKRFGYDPTHGASDAPPRAVPPAANTPPPLAAPVGESESRVSKVLRQFGKIAEIRQQVDLRPRFFELQLQVKDQGRRPSCSIFAIVSALEFQNAELIGRAEKFSEEYLLWAVRQSLQRTSTANSTNNSADDKDEGFTLAEVVGALRAYGIPLQSSMPNTLGRGAAAIEAPPATVIDEARRQQRVFVHVVPGRDMPTRINNIVAALNAGLPVPIGLAWPNYRSLRSGYLSAQKPMSGAGHAVTLVGYRCTSGRLEDAVFIFKNSWGTDWGQGGYGVVTFAYLQAHLHDAILLELQSSSR